MTSTGILNGKLVTLFGGGGFLGKHVAQALMLAGARVRVVQRHPEKAYGVRALGNLGQCQLVTADAANEDAAVRAAQDSDAIVNLVGILKGDFEHAHHHVAANTAAAAKATAARALVHISAIGADADSPSAYGRSKAAGELAARFIFPATTILRPSIVFGRGDQFINRFASMMTLSPFVPVISGKTRFQPVFVGDVAEAVVSAVANPGVHGGKTYALGGPQVMSMRGLLEWIAQATGRNPVYLDVPDFAARALAAATGWLPGAPITKDQMAMLSRDNVAGDAPGLAALGIAPTPIAAVAGEWLDIYRPHGRFAGKRAAA